MVRIRLVVGKIRVNLKEMDVSQCDVPKSHEMKERIRRIAPTELKEMTYSKILFHFL